MQLRDIGEGGLLARIERAASRLAQPGVVRLGIGDDAAILRPGAGQDVVATTDALVEGVHFRLANEAASTVGRRALVANLSDLAAMGARPLGFLWALAAPATLEVKVVDGFVRGMLAEAARHGCPLVGGNLTGAGEISLNITALGVVRRGCALTREGARAGDRICVTGTLGGAALARARAERGGVQRHVAVPRLAAGRALTGVRGVGGCIDVSDGLAADLARLTGPGLAAEVEPGSLPLPRGFAAACAREGLDPLALAGGGGEDYELLFTLRAGAPSAAALRRRLGVPVAEIGRLVVRRGGSAAAPGWRHFA